MRKLVLLAAAGAVAVGIAVPLALASASASTVKITEKEFKITPSPTSVAAGKVTFKIKNAGALDHTFDVVKTSLARLEAAGEERPGDAEAARDVGAVQAGEERNAER